MLKDLKEDGQTAADADGRSLSSWIVRAIRKALGEGPPGVMLDGGEA